MARTSENRERQYRSHHKSAITQRIGAILELARIEQDLSLAEAATRAGFSAQQLFGIEHAVHDIRISTLERACRALGLSIAEVIAIADDG